MSLYPELDGRTLEELEDRFRTSPPGGADEADLYYPEVASRIREWGEIGVAFLLQSLGSADVPRVRAILFALTTPPVDGANLRDVLLDYLDHEHPLVVAQAIDGLRHIGDADTLPTIVERFAHHPSPYVRGSVLRYVARFEPDTALPLLRTALNDPDFIVRENAADELGNLRRPELRGYLLPLLADPHPDVRQAARTAIELLEDLQGHARYDRPDDDPH